MSKIYLTFGINPAGQWQSISETPSGRSNLVCPWCKRALIAKKGRIKTIHFAHDGETCRISQDAALQTQIPTYDTFEMLDTHEARYLERRIQYGSHGKVYSWDGMNEAIDRLEKMGIVSVERTNEAELIDVRARLGKLDGQWLDDLGQPTKALLDLFKALDPLVDLRFHWNRCTKIKSTKIDRSYSQNQFDKLKSLSDLDRAQRYWFDAYWRRLAAVAPDYQELLAQKYSALGQQSLYVIHISGEFEGLPPEFIKIGLSTRNANVRLKEILADLKPFGQSIKGEVLAVKEHAGRLERLLHRMLSQDNLPIGTFTEFFATDRLEWLLSELNTLTITKYSPPESETDAGNEPVKLAGRRKKNDAELLAEYEDIAVMLQAGNGIREVSRITGRSVNTVQKVKAALSVTANF